MRRGIVHPPSTDEPATGDRWCGSPGAAISAAMADHKKSRLRRWQAMLSRNRGEVLGTVEAPDEQAAKHVAAERFTLTEHQLTRLALREMR
jgi:hypothetical protein